MKKVVAARLKMFVGLKKRRTQKKRLIRCAVLRLKKMMPCFALHQQRRVHEHWRRHQKLLHQKNLMLMMRCLKLE